MALMTRAQKRALRDTLLGFLYSLVGAFAFMRFFRGKPQIDRGDVITAALVSILITTGMSLVYVYLLPLTRPLKLLPAVLLRAAGYFTVVMTSLLVGVLLANIIDNGYAKGVSNFTGILSRYEFRAGVVFAVIVILGYTLLVGISQKLGPGVLFSWLSGRYHQPKEVERIFMFLDLRDSTGLAEKLGPLRFSSLIRDFFADITTPLLDHGARVSHFIGDEVVIYWRMNRGLEDQNVVRCFFAVRDEIERRAPVYSQRYGVVPTFKAGAHCGNVIATDVGQIKSEIVYHGDVLNVAARLQSMCKDEGCDLLISGDLSSRLNLNGEFSARNLGPRELKGRVQPVEVVAVEKA